MTLRFYASFLKNKFYIGYQIYNLSITWQSFQMSKSEADADVKMIKEIEVSFGSKR